MSGDGNGEEKERLNNIEFGDLIPHLPLQDLLKVEYRINNWDFLIEVRGVPPKKLYCCSLCSVTQSSVKNVYAHIDGKKHKSKMKNIRQLYHSQYTYLKEQSDLAGNMHDKTVPNIELTSKDQVPTFNIPIQKTLSSTLALGNNSKNTPTKQIENSPVIENKINTRTLDLAATLIKNGLNESSKNETQDCKRVKEETEKNIPFNIKESEKISECLHSSVIQKTTSAVQGLGNANYRCQKQIPKESVPNISAESPATFSNKLTQANKNYHISNIKNSAIDTTVLTKSARTKNIVETNKIPNKKSQTKANIATVVTLKDIKMAETLNKTDARNSKSNKKFASHQTIILDNAIQIINNTEFSANVSNGTNNANAGKAQIQCQIVNNPLALKLDCKMQQDYAKTENVNKINCVPTSNLLSTLPVADFFSDVIVIDDESPSDEEKNKDFNTKTLETVIELQSKEIVEPVAKRQKVVNPASAVLVKAVEIENKECEVKEDSNKIKYQSNIVIIPTIDKHKANVTSKLHSKPEPKFSNKTFSSKPNDDDIQGLLGVEYVVKILKCRQDQSPKYECGLCELILDGPSMQNHLIGHNHRLKFCEKHFPTAIRQYRQFMVNVPQHEVFKVFTPILAKLAVAIEKHHGRDLPYECFEREFNINRHEVLSKVFSCRHASEQYGPTFIHVVDAKEIDEFVAQRHNYKPFLNAREATFDVRPGRGSRFRNKSPLFRANNRSQTIIKTKCSSIQHFPAPHLSSHNEISLGRHIGNVSTVDDETHKLMVEDFLRGTTNSLHMCSPNRVFDRECRYRRHCSRSHSYDLHRSRSRSLTKARKSISPLRNNDIWQAYRHMVDQKVNELDDVFEVFRKDPERHPMYEEEWQKFWKRRKDELIAARLDHRTYNYQPEWVRFFKVRIEELYSQAVENIKIQSRERLCLPLTNQSLADSKYHTQSGTSQIHPYALNIDEHNSVTKETLESKNSITVVTVLRLMTALEEYLGSLGPKIINLLSKALQAEKYHPVDVNNLILTAENCSLLEVAMEKFKGLLIAGILEGSKERALKKAVEEIGELLNIAELKRRENPLEHSRHATSTESRTAAVNREQVAEKSQTKSILVTQHQNSHNTLKQAQSQSSKILGTMEGNLFSQIDKNELAVKLASALAAQGKTDFDLEQLQHLIAVYTLLEKKKRETVSVLAATTTRKSLSDTLANLLNQPASSGFTQNYKKVSELNQNNAHAVEKVCNYVDMMRPSSGELTTTTGSQSQNYRSVDNFTSKNIQYKSSNTSISSIQGNCSLSNHTQQTNYGNNNLTSLSNYQNRNFSQNIGFNTTLDTSTNRENANMNYFNNTTTNYSNSNVIPINQQRNCYEQYQIHQLHHLDMRQKRNQNLPWSSNGKRNKQKNLDSVFQNTNNLGQGAGRNSNWR